MYGVFTRKTLFALLVILIVVLILMGVAGNVMGVSAAPRELPDRGAPLYVYCRSGGRSRRAAALLKRMGYTNVTDIGGIADYRGRVVR